MGRPGDQEEDRGGAAADGSPVAAALEAMIARAEAARRRYVERLADPGLPVAARGRCRQRLKVLQSRLDHLRAERAALGETPAPPLRVPPQPQRRRARASYRAYLPRKD